MTDRIDGWMREHGMYSQQAVSGAMLIATVIGCALVAWLLVQCNQPAYAPMPPSATPTPFESTFIAPATITLTRTATKTWTREFSPTAKSTPSSTATITATLTPTLSTPTPTAAASTFTPTIGLLTTPGRNTLPRTGASAQEIADMTATATPTIEPTPNRITLPVGCVYHSLYLEPGLGYDVLVFHCPSVLKDVTPQGVGTSD